MTPAFVLSILGLFPNPIPTARPSTLVIVERTVTEVRRCSATAVGPHALLTASHCELPTDEFATESGVHKIIGVPIRDGADHSIFLTDATFENYAEIGEAPNQGDPVFIFGNPAGHLHLFRSGSLAGTDQGVLLFNLNSFHGDSGAAIFNRKGQICAVVSIIVYERLDDQYWALTGAFPLQFSAEQIQKARTFEP